MATAMPFGQRQHEQTVIPVELERGAWRKEWDSIENPHQISE
jgi:hypothetical protein